MFMASSGTAKSIQPCKTWAELITADVKKSGSRRAEHLLHAKYCNGSLDHLHSVAEVAERKARCAKICGLCRYIYSLKQWPQSTYCRPSTKFLRRLEEQEWCVTWKSEAPADFTLRRGW